MGRALHMSSCHAAVRGIPAQWPISNKGPEWSRDIYDAPEASRYLPWKRGAGIADISPPHRHRIDTPAPGPTEAMCTVFPTVHLFPMPELASAMRLLTWGS
ncbi:hypothetical protein GCM10009757_32210 [Streptomyces cheonanensis]|uniref:Uncharacterized protein n=1 Tax=Streptomyces cheonanensis TaxID=312720 RepID=A0ABP5GTH4_9ACTN